MEQSQLRLCCRICLGEQDNEHSPSKLVSPCKCAGTQRHIHLKCLRTWQENVQKHNKTDERAFRCGVCRSVFSKEYLPQTSRAAAQACTALRGVGGAICVVMLAFGLSGPPWPHLALLVLLLLGTRSSSLLALGLLIAGSLLAALHARGLRVVMRMDGAGRLGLALIRHGAPLPGLGPGTLLVASEGLDNTMFRHSVVLLYSHNSQGAKGVLLSQGLPPPATDVGLGSGPPAPPNRQQGGGSLAEARQGPPSQKLASEISIQHFLGGPVGMPGEGVRQEVVLLHGVEGVPGATHLPLMPLPRPCGPGSYQAGAASLRSDDAMSAGTVAEARMQSPGGADVASAGSPLGTAPCMRAAGGEAGDRSGAAEQGGQGEGGDLPARAGPSSSHGRADVYRGSGEGTVRCTGSVGGAAGCRLRGGMGGGESRDAGQGDLMARGSAACSARGAAGLAGHAAVGAGGGEWGSAAWEGSLHGQRVGDDAGGDGLGDASQQGADVAARGLSADLESMWREGVQEKACELYVGGLLPDVLEKAAVGPTSARWVNVYHGVCAWAEGQLEGEIRNGAWRYAPARLQDVLSAGNDTHPRSWRELHDAVGVR